MCTSIKFNKKLFSLAIIVGCVSSNTLLYGEYSSSSATISTLSNGIQSISTLPSSSFSLNEISSIAGINSNFSCPGIPIPGLPTIPNISGLLNKLNFNFGPCNSSAQQKDIECIDSKIRSGYYSLLPSGAVAAAQKEKLYDTTCNKQNPSVSAATIVKNGMYPNSRVGNKYRQCLDMIGSSCDSNSYKLPNSHQETEKEIYDTIKISTVGMGNLYIESQRSENTIREGAESSCSDGKCSSIYIQQAFKNSEDKRISAIKKSAGSEHTLLKNSSLPTYYFYDSSDEVKKMMPISMQKEFISISHRTQNTEALLSGIDYDIGTQTMNLVIAQSNKNKSASSPLLNSPIQSYALEVLNAR